MKIALIGTRGVPAQYGGFETCVEQVGLRLVKAGHEVVVYCRATEADSDTEPPLETYLGMQLVHLPAVRKKSLETLSHTAASVRREMRDPADVAIVFNSANAVFLPLLRRRGVPVATHVDGLEWRRAKWQGAGKRYYRFAESMAVRWSDALIADAQGIADYYRDEFAASTDLIAYGAPITRDDRPELLEKLDLTPHGYHLAVARFEPENHVDVIVDAYRRSRAELPLIVVGAAPYSDDYTAKIITLGESAAVPVRFLGSVWDQDLLDQLYANSATYFHGHSVGGTNPSLLRAIGAGAPTVAYDVNFNREVLGRSGLYFDSADQLVEQIEYSEQHRDEMRDRGQELQHGAARYDWDDVAEKYEALCQRLYRMKATGSLGSRAARPSGRRSR